MSLDPDTWIAVWQPVIDRIGSNLDDDVVRWGPDVVEAGAIRRFLEPLEFDCPLHYEPAEARAHGHPGIIAPYVSVWTFMFPAVWSPGQPPTFADASRDAQPTRSAMYDSFIPGAPPTAAVIATNITMEFARPLNLGERVGAAPRRLLACTPKETSIGRGAFVTFERWVVNEALERLCRIETENYLYEQHESG